MFNIALVSVTNKVTELVTMALVFVTLAILVKRGAIRDAIGRAKPEIVTNLWLWLINAAVIVPLAAVPIMTGSAIIPRAETLVNFWLGVPELLTLFATVLFIELAAYWRHRFEHARSLWPIHATHHAVEAMTWLSVRRKHPFGNVFSMVCDNLVVLALGLPFWAIVGAMILRGWWGYFIHADVPLTLGPLGKVLISPAAHRLHHIRDEARMGHNFGNMLTIWDQLFGTYRDPAPFLDCETGIAEGTRDAWGELIRPFEARY
jgi:sterol desaturase/sphingolipid hydroxylase (fatty acid hydroxylase superfamily)